MRRNLYIAAFVAVLLIACIGGFVGGRVLLARLQGDFTPRAGATATPVSVAELGASPSPAPQQVVTPEAPPATQARRATATVLVVPAPVTDQPLVLTTEPTWTAGIELPTLETPLPFETLPPDGSPMPEPSATPIPVYPFELAHAVRYSSNDCPGTYALGQVTDRSGLPLPGIRLKLIDEFGNAATAVTKPGPGDTGRYDFPMGGPGRLFYMSVVDQSDRPLSPEVEILHDLAPEEGKNCRWVDWRRN